MASRAEPAPPTGATPPFSDNRLFRGLEAGTLAVLAAIPEPCTFGSGDIIVDQGEAGGDLFLIADGRVAITARAASGRQQRLATMEGGDYFGEMAVLDPAPRSARVTALTETRIGRVDADGLRKMLERAPLQLARNLMIDSIHRLRDVDTLLIAEMVRAERLSLLGTMTAGIMHDVRNPLSVITGVAQLLEMQEDRPEHERWAAMLKRSVRGITSLVQDVLDYARGTSAVQMGDVYPDRLIEDVSELLARKIESRHVELVTEVALPGPVRVDRERFGRVLANIIANGIDAMPDGGTIGIRVDAADDTVRFTITDTGSGIPDEILPVLFEPFATHGKKGGTGLGMAIAKAVVEAHQGTIEVSTRRGEGTTFVVRVPA